MFENRWKLDKKTETEKSNHMSKFCFIMHFMYVVILCMHYHNEFKIIIQFSGNFSHANNIKMLISWYFHVVPGVVTTNSQKNLKFIK